MKSWTLIASYLWKDTWSRWLEQPSSLLARLFVGSLLVLVATVILVSLHLLERGAQARLEAFGLNTLVVRELITANDPELFCIADRPDRLAPLNSEGQKLRLRQLLMRAQSEWHNDLLVMSYPSTALPMLAPWLSTETPLVYFTDKLPENLLTRVSLLRQSGRAIVRRLPNFFRSVVTENLLLVPQGWASEVERGGFMETTFFQRGTAARSMEKYIEAIATLPALDRRAPPQIQSALPLLRELEQLQERQRQWRTVLAGVLGLVMALVYGAIAILEFRQNLFIGALLRSLGTPAPFLFVRQWLESMLIANVAALGTVLFLATFHQQVFSALGFSRSLLEVGSANPYWNYEVALILICVNAGAFLSSLPVALGLRRPVGTILS